MSLKILTEQVIKLLCKKMHCAHFWLKEELLFQQEFMCKAVLCYLHSNGLVH